MLKGNGISDGIGLGKVILLKKEKIKPEKIKIDNVEAEKEIFQKALKAVEEETASLVEKLTGTEKEIMQAYLMILQDPNLVEETVKIIEQEKCNAAYGVDKGFQRLSKCLKKSMTLIWQQEVEILPI